MICINAVRRIFSWKWKKERRERDWRVKNICLVYCFSILNFLSMSLTPFFFFWKHFSNWWGNANGSSIFFVFHNIFTFNKLERGKLFHRQSRPFRSNSFGGGSESSFFNRSKKEKYINGDYSSNKGLLLCRSVGQVKNEKQRERERGSDRKIEKRFMMKCGKLSKPNYACHFPFTIVFLW